MFSLKFPGFLNLCGFFGLLAWVIPQHSHAATEVLQEGTIRVTVDAASGEFQMEADGKPVLVAAHGGNGGKFVRSEWILLNEPMGATRALQLHYDNHRSVLLALFPGKPFLCLRQGIYNPADSDTEYSREIVLESTVEWATSAPEIKAFGTDGLSSPAKNPGSYMYQALVDTQSGAGLVAGWISTARASGVLFTPVEKDRVRLQGVSEYGKLLLKPKSSERGEWLCIGNFRDARLGLEAYADLVALFHSIKLPAQPSGYCTWYSSPHGKAGDEAHTAELAAYCAKELKPFGFSFIQIDDGWQCGKMRNGPAKNFTTHNPTGPYAAGMKAAAESITRHGLTAGLWFMPFAADHQDPWFAEMQEWFVKRQDGKIFETEWGGSSLDMSHAAAQEHLRSLVRTFTRDWGMRYLKMDGLYTGLAVDQLYVHESYRKDGIELSQFANPYMTSVEIFRRALEIVREEAGHETYLLGCCIPQNLRSMGASFGLVDAMRIGPDNDAQWKVNSPGGVLVGPTHGARRWFFHNRIWHNDPDPIYVRPSLSLDQARAIASWSAISGQLNTHSEWTPELPSERLEILRRTLPAHSYSARPVDVFDRDIPRIWSICTDGTPTRVVLGVFNWDRESTEITVPLEKLGLAADQAHEGWEYWSNKRLTEIKGELKLTLPATSCMMLVLRPSSPAPMVLSSARHVLQGLLEVSGETWNAEKKTLSGKLQVVGNDPGELRIVLPNNGENWGDGTLTLGEADAAAGVRASLSRDDAVRRVRIESPENREIVWSVQW